MSLPRSLSPRSQRFKVRVAEALAQIELPDDDAPRRRARARAADDAELEALRSRLRAHPVHSCPDLADHEQWMQRFDQLERETSSLDQRVRRRTGSLVRTFDQVLAVLRGLGYVEDFTLTAKGETLRRVYNEADLVVVEAVHRGVWTGLEPAELAAVVSALVYEARGRDPGPLPAVMPTAKVKAAVNALDDLEAEVLAFERSEGLSLTRPLESDFVERTWRWARGERLDDILDEDELSPGDFVRVMKQLVDLLRQIGAVAEDPELHRTGLDAIDAVLRGVVAYSSLE